MLKSNKHFPIWCGFKRGYLFSFVHPRARVEGNVRYTEIQSEAAAVSIAVLMAQAMILGEGEIIPWKPEYC